MWKHDPEFGLNGKIEAQGEDAQDRWLIKMKDNVAVREEVGLCSHEIICPHCDELIDTREL